MRRRFGWTVFSALAIALSVAACVPAPAPDPVPFPGPVLGPPVNPAATFRIAARSVPAGRAVYGDYVRLELTVDADVLVHAYLVEPDGHALAIAENAPLSAGVRLRLPDDRGAWLKAAPPAGAETFIVLATRSPLPPLAAAGAPLTLPVPLSIDADDLVRALSDRVAALPSSAWASAIVQLSVEAP